MTAARVPDPISAIIGNAGAAEFAAIGDDVSSLVGRTRDMRADLVAAHTELADAGLAFLADLVTPLQRCLDQVTGDTDSLLAKADDWRAVEADLRETVPRVGRLAAIAQDTWHGSSAGLFDDRMREFTGVVEGAAAAAGGVTTMLRTSAELMDGARKLVGTLIAEVVDFMIAAEAMAEASRFATAGASEAAALSAILGEVSAGVEKAIDIIDKVADLLERIGKALRDLHGVFDRVAQLVVSLTKLGSDLASDGAPDGSPDSGGAAR